MIEHYKGHILEPRPHELADGTGWSSEIYISPEQGPLDKNTRFVLRHSYGSLEQALKAAVAAGKKTIDKSQLGR